MGGKKKALRDQEQQPASESEKQPSEESFSKGAKKKKQPIKKSPKPNVEKKKSTPKKQTQAKESSANKTQSVKGKSKNAEVTKEDKKKDFLPGQKYPTPEDEDGALAFYKSLYEKNSKSDMARRWCLEYGVLEPQEAARVLKQLGKGKK